MLPEHHNVGSAAYGELDDRPLSLLPPCGSSGDIVLSSRRPLPGVSYCVPGILAPVTLRTNIVVATVVFVIIMTLMAQPLRARRLSPLSNQACIRD